MDWQLIGTATAASAAAGLATAAGALPVLAIPGISRRLETIFLGFSAGVMLAASFFSLILPGLEAAESSGHSSAAAAFIIAGAILIGALTLQLVNHYVPHEHFLIGRNPTAAATRLARIWLFVIAITLHNFPEGLAVGVSFGGNDMANGAATALGIGIQNVPEGLAVAVSLASVGYGRLFSFVAAFMTGLVEPVGGFLGISAVTASSALLPWGLGFAAGAMIWVVSSEIIPETHREGRQNAATTALMAGLVLMLCLDWSLG
ncbi:ZIP family metal transporter [Allosphingosinicella sp.]|uniref:ZIP family metal transporter n=1 Tax=Allosphingosinicella sp. TaxID=2823234 RepID=UPI002FC1CCF8